MASAKSTTSVRLTKSTVEAAAPGVLWDRDLKGFGVRVSPQGARAYFVHRRTPVGKQVAITIGRHGSPWTAEQARARAKQLLGQIANGIDPSADRREARQAELARREAPTVQVLLERYMAEHAERRKRQRSVETDRSLIHKHLLAALRWRRVAEVAHDDVERLHAQISIAAPIAANRAVALLSKAMSLAIKWGMRADNPCKGIERNHEERRERYLAPAELGRLCDALNRRHDKLEAAAIVFMMLTGARRGETLAAHWRDFDPSGIWSKPASTTKSKKLHRVPLSAAARAVLAQLAERYSPDGPPPDGYVFGPDLIHKVRGTWEAVRDEAGLPGLRLHDLRHAYASLLVSGGLSLPIIGALLGHSSPTTTNRYAHLLDDPLRQATERVGSLWTELSNGGQLPPPQGGRS